MSSSPNPSHSPSRRRGIGCLLASMVLLALMGGFGLVLAGLGGGAGRDHLREVAEERVPGATGKLVWLTARGVMVEGGGLGHGPGITGELLDMLRRARDDDDVRGVLLELDTPGGSVTDADLIHHRIGELKATGKKVVVLMGDLCASGGLYAAVAADRIVAHPTTTTGSIGVILSALNVADLLGQHGVKDTSIVSGPNKALLSPTAPVDPNHVAILQGVVDALFQRFVKLVAEGRNLPVEKVRALADGRVLTADQALAAGLVDEIGYADAAVTALRTLVDGPPCDLVRYETEPSLIDLLRAQAPAPETAVLARIFAAPRAMYLLSPLGPTAGVVP